VLWSSVDQGSYSTVTCLESGRVTSMVILTVSLKGYNELVEALRNNGK
jgi:hypothetical protein